MAGCCWPAGAGRSACCTSMASTSIYMKSCRRQHAAGGRRLGGDAPSWPGLNDEMKTWRTVVCTCMTPPCLGESLCSFLVTALIEPQFHSSVGWSKTGYDWQGETSSCRNLLPQRKRLTPPSAPSVSGSGEVGWRGPTRGCAAMAAGPGIWG